MFFKTMVGEDVRLLRACGTGPVAIKALSRGKHDFHACVSVCIVLVYQFWVEETTRVS